MKFLARFGLAPSTIEGGNHKTPHDVEIKLGSEAVPSRTAFEISDEANDSWRFFHQHRRLTLPREPMFTQDDTFFTAGSCFAVEIRKALRQRGLCCAPDYRRIAFNPASVKIGSLPERENMNLYNTFSIRQEAERAAGLWSQDDDDIWTLPDRILKNGRVVQGQGTVYQDPYQRLVFATDKPALIEAIKALGAATSEGLRRASAIVITLGLTEVFVKADNNLVANQTPLYGRGGGEAETRFHASSYNENLENVERTIALLKTLNPSARVVISVSPVPLERTFSGDDVYVATMRSKSILLAVAREICSRHDHCYYFPSYEFVSSLGSAAFQDKDGRHVKIEVVDEIVRSFIAATFRPATSS